MYILYISKKILVYTNMAINKLHILALIIMIFIFLNCLKKYERFSSKKELIIILPIRDREEDLKKYLENMIPIFKYQNLNYKIFIIEQTTGKKFNKGKINNVGFIEANKVFPNSQRFLFNDIDNFPIKKDIIDYGVNLEGIHHLFGNPRWLGGFYLVRSKDFKKINGYSNNFWGWGGEDNDLKSRSNAFNIKINRDTFFRRHKQKLIIDNKNVGKKDKNVNFHIQKNMYQKKYQSDKNNVYKDGLKNCNYKVVKRQKNYNNNKNIERILVDI